VKKQGGSQRRKNPSKNDKWGASLGKKMLNEFWPFRGKTPQPQKKPVGQKEEHALTAGGHSKERDSHPRERTNRPGSLGEEQTG